MQVVVSGLPPTGGSEQIAGLQDRKADLASHPSFRDSPITLAKDDGGTSG
jgi:hypothetical protein